MRRFLPAFVLAAMFMPTAAHAAWSTYADHGTVLSTAGTFPGLAAIVTDGKNGCIVMWSESRAGNNDVYVQRLDVNGNARWTANGAPITAAAGDQFGATAITDGAGGAFVVWNDNTLATGSLFAQHIDSTGTKLWAAGGVQISNLANPLSNPALALDGAGGVIVAFERAFTNTDHDIFAQRLNAAGVVQWSAPGFIVANSTSFEDHPQIVSDGAGGGWITWISNLTGGGYRIHGCGISSGGSVSTDTDLLALGTFVLSQTMCPDGNGGAWVTWDELSSDFDVLWAHMSHGFAFASNILAGGSQAQDEPVAVPDGAHGLLCAFFNSASLSGLIDGQHVAANGTPQWGFAGVDIGTTPGGNDLQPGGAVSDGTGGMIVVWQNSYLVGSSLYAQHVNGLGTTAYTTWGSARPVMVTAWSEGSQKAVPDGAGGACVAFIEDTGTLQRLVVQHIDGYGMLGDSSPRTAGVRDVPNDQGGRVRVSWTPSDLDTTGTDGIASYTVWRQAPAALAQAALRRGARLLRADEQPAAGERALRTTIAGTQTFYWENVATVAAQQLAGYSVVAATTSDSIAGATGNPRSVFMVEAVSSADSRAHWYSAPDSGYSVDNLPPALPSGFAGTFVEGSGAFLHWNANVESDLAGYHVYRGGSAGFTPSPGNRVATTNQTWFDDSGAGPAYYKLCAFDVHGNEGDCAMLLPVGATDAPSPQAPRVSFLAPVVPDPAPGRASVRFGLAHDADVRLSLYDPQGRLVRTLALGSRPAGSYAIAWDGRDAAGAAVRGGLYFARLAVREAGAATTFVQRFAVVR
ncbi:MAG TPA: FlgD immunoglobulin-like domain containing protein [Candidatus Eisenbacteria bacterium]|nr:FlgD immunoglobulin-like domain containing protein [Candidatus Eisenbacteria bacterium]